MKLSSPAQRKIRIEMVPLIDTFFLLLAFFISSMLSMSILKGLPIELPSVGQATSLDRKEVVLITITREEQIQMDGEPAGLHEIASRLQGMSTPVANLRVAVRADRAVPTGRLAEVLEAVRLAGVRRLGLVTDSATTELANDG